MIKKILLTISVILMLIILAGAGIFFWAAFHTWTLPDPTGAFSIGLTDLALTDSSRQYPFSRDYAGPRELLLWIWYPSESRTGVKPEPFTKRSWGAVEQFAKMMSLPPVLFRSMEKVNSHSCRDIPISNMQDAYPVVIFTHGLGIGSVGQNMSECEELASNGYIVISIAHTYESLVVPFPDGKLINADMTRWKEFLSQANVPLNKSPLIAMNRFHDLSSFDSLTREFVRMEPLLDETHKLWTDDTKFVLGKLDMLKAHAVTGSFFTKLDLDRIGIFGHSMGGMTAQKTAFEDRHITAGISYDAVPIIEAVEDSMRVPFMFMNCEMYRAAGEPLYARAIHDAYYAVIKGSVHFNFADFSLSMNKSPLWKIIGFSGTIDPSRCKRIINSCTLAFFNRYLKNNESVLQDLPVKYPELSLRFKLRQRQTMDRDTL